MYGDRLLLSRTFPVITMVQDGLDRERLGDLHRYEEEIAVLERRRERLYEQVKTERQNKREAVADLLYGLQDSLEHGESVPLIRMTEDYGRGGRWTYEETLTGDGVVANDIRHIGAGSRDAAVDELSWWPDEEPLDISEDYIVERRAGAQYINRLADRIRTVERGGTDVPRHSLQYNGPYRG